MPVETFSAFCPKRRLNAGLADDEDHRKFDDIYIHLSIYHYLYNTSGVSSSLASSFTLLDTLDRFRYSQTKQLSNTHIEHKTQF